MASHIIMNHCGRGARHTAVVQLARGSRVTHAAVSHKSKWLLILMHIVFYIYFSYEILLVSFLLLLIVIAAILSVVLVRHIFLQFECLTYVFNGSLLPRLRLNTLSVCHK